MGYIGDVPSEKMFGQFPEQAREEGNLQSGFEMYHLIRDDFVNQTKHAIGKQKRKQIFQHPFNCGPRSYEKPPLITLENGKKRA